MLRAVRDDDLPLFYAWQADEGAAAMAAVASRDREAFEAHWSFIRCDEAMLLRTIEVDGAPAGNIGSFIDEGRVMVGYWIDRAYWGRGIATQALREFLAIEHRRPLVATVAVHNAGSLRVVEKCGFTRVGERPGDDGVTIIEFVLA
jgi:RimJ/RimL family protein N-acetyltransferase